MTNVKWMRLWRVPSRRLLIVGRRISTPLIFADGLCGHIERFFKKIKLFGVLEYIGKLTVLTGILVYVGECSERNTAREDAKKSKHYQAWQQIGLSRGMRGNSGRVTALQDLNGDKVSLAHMDLN